jgi:hypothetical protein
MGWRLAVANARSSTALAASQAAALLYSAAAIATLPPTNITRVGYGSWPSLPGAGRCLRPRERHRELQPAQSTGQETLFI